MIEYFQKCIKNYIDKELIPSTKRKSGEQMLANYVENYRRYIIFSNMMEKLFGYMNNYHIKNEKAEELGIWCMK